MSGGRRRKPINHGTIGGYRAHYRHGVVPPCEPCRDAERRRQGYKAPQKQAVCGTRGGYNRHLIRREETCADCRAAVVRDRAERCRRGLPAGDRRHGTRSGYLNYRCRCEPCRHAGSVENARRRDAQRATK